MFLDVDAMDQTKKDSRFRKSFGCEFGIQLAYLGKQYTIRVNMIRSFRCRDTERLANDEVVPDFPVT